MVNMSAPRPAGAPAPAPGGGDKFDPDKLDEIIGKWKALREDLQNDRTSAEAMAGVKAPGK